MPRNGVALVDQVVQAGHEPPQSVPVSSPFCMRSLQVGAATSGALASGSGALASTSGAASGALASAGVAPMAKSAVASNAPASASGAVQTGGSPSAQPAQKTAAWPCSMGAE